MSLAAVKHEIASLLDYGHLHVVDAKILVSQKILGPHTSPAEHAALKAFKDKVDSGAISSSPEARAVLAAAVKAGPTSILGYAGGVALNAAGWGLGLAVVGGVLGAGVALVSGGGHSGWQGLAAVAGGGVGAAAGGGVGLLYGTYRTVRD
jgi:hypothetical protein